MNDLVRYRAPEPPALIYLAGLGDGSRRSQCWTLRVMAAEMSGGQMDHVAFPWHRLDPIRIGVVRSTLSGRYAPTTVNRAMAALRGTLKAAWLGGLVEHAEYQRLLENAKDVPGNATRTGRMLERHEIERLFKAAGANPDPAIALRDMAILAVLFECGLRTCELRRLDLEDYSSGSLKVRRSKGGKTRVMPLNKAEGRILCWLVSRGTEPGPLFPGVGGRRMHQNTIPWILASLSRRAGVGHWTPHDGRRTFISMVLGTGSDLATASALAGHSNPRTTAGYDKRPQEARIAAVGRLELPL